MFNPARNMTVRIYLRSQLLCLAGAKQTAHILEDDGAGQEPAPWKRDVWDVVSSFGAQFIHQPLGPNSKQLVRRWSMKSALALHIHIPHMNWFIRPRYRPLIILSLSTPGPCCWAEDRFKLPASAPVTASCFDISLAFMAWPVCC